MRDVPLAVLLAALIAAGCGATREQGAPTAAHFIAGAEAFCRHERAKLAYIAAYARARALSPQSPRVIRQQAAQSQLATARLQTLAQPADEARAIGRWLTARTVAATVALDLAEAPPHGQQRAVADVRAQAGRTLAQASALASSLGLRTCSEVG
jgi:hypothetical protein